MRGVEACGGEAFDEAVCLSRQLTEAAAADVDWQPLWDRLGDIVAADPQAAIVLGLAHLGSADRIELDVAVQLLGVAAEIDEAVREVAATAIIGLAGTAAGAGVRSAIAYALGRTGDSRGLPVLVDFAADADRDVRLGVVWSIASVLSPAPEEAGIATLIELCHDRDDDVRDWATFSLGTLIDADSPAIRAALWDSAYDLHRETRQEGAVGLARRREPGALGLIAKMLANDDNGNCVIEAAAYLAHPDLVAPLRLFDDPADVYVATALRECDPRLRDQRDDFGWAVLEEIRARRPDLQVAVVCRLYEIGVDLIVSESSIDDETRTQPVSWLLDKFGGDVALAADHMLATR